MARKPRSVSERKFLQIEQKDPNVPASHPFKNIKNHQALLEYCLERVDFANALINPLKDRFEIIDVKLAGFLRLDPDDRSREQDNLKGKDPKPVKMNPQFALTQLARGVTYLASVFSPENGVYEALAQKDKQQAANAIVHLMNQNSIKGKYFREQCKFFLNALKFNLGAAMVEWKEDYGNKITGVGGETKVERKMIYSGNTFKSTNMYNTFWDPSVHPCEVHCEGEFAGIIEMLTPFAIKRMASNGEIFNFKEALQAGVSQAKATSGYYRAIPGVRITNSASSDILPNGEVNWASILSMGSVKGYEAGSGELITIFIRLLPTDFGLIYPRDAKTRDGMEIWRIQILNGLKIVSTEYINNIHDYLPMVFTSPVEDDLGLQVKSHGENLYPFQDLAAFMLNSFTAGVRANIWDMTLYDPSMVDLSAVGSDVAARIPVKDAAHGKDIRTFLYHYNKNLEVDKLLQQMAGVLDLLEWIFPTRMAQQITDMDRAVKDQVAAVVQATNRESWKLAKIIDDQAMSVSRFIMHSNIVQYQPTMELIMPDGTTQEISPSLLRELQLEFTIGEGLQTIDRLSKQLHAKDLLQTILSSGAASQFDIPALTNYLSQFQGVQLDLTQFRLDPAKQAAQAAAQKGQSAPVDPNAPPAGA